MSCRGSRVWSLGDRQCFRCELKVLLLSADAELLPSQQVKVCGAGWGLSLALQRTGLCQAGSSSVLSSSAHTFVLWLLGQGRTGKGMHVPPCTAIPASLSH